MDDLTDGFSWCKVYDDTFERSNFRVKSSRLKPAYLALFIFIIMRPIIKLEPNLEQKVKETAIKYLVKGKPEWDVAHALKSVGYIKELIKNEGGNARILVTAVYLLNIGYAKTEISKEAELGLAKVLTYKQKHASAGAAEAEKVLRQIGEFSKEEIGEICRLVYTHDEWWNHHQKNFNEHFNDFLITEADTLGMIDPDMPQNFSPQEQKKFIDSEVLPFRMPLFKTLYGKVKFKELLARLLRQLEKDLAVKTSI